MENIIRQASEIADIAFIVVISSYVYSISKRVKVLEDKEQRRMKKRNDKKR